MQTDSCVFCPFHCPPKEKAYSCLKPSRALFIMFDGWGCSQTLGLRLYGGRPGLMHWPFTFANGSVRVSPHFRAAPRPASVNLIVSRSRRINAGTHHPSSRRNCPCFPWKSPRVGRGEQCGSWNRGAVTCGQRVGRNQARPGVRGCPVVSAALSAILPRCHSSWSLCRPSWRTPEPSRLPGSPCTLGLQRPPAETPPGRPRS